MFNRNSLLQLLEAYSGEQRYQEGPQNLYEPVRYVMSMGGKKIRPLLTMMAAQLFKADPKEVLPAAYAIELFHNFSLLHDDIMDEAPIRRGKPAVHIKYGLNAGILSGDVMLVLVYDYLQKLPDSANLKQVLHLFNTAAVEVCEGQQLDVDFESMSNVSEEDYIGMIEKKTAALLGAALGLGGIPFCDAQTLSQLDGFGRKLGIAFQLMDDLLDTFGETHKVGKQKGGDIIQNKKTILTIQALKAASKEDKENLEHWMTQDGSNPELKVKEVTDIYIRSGVVEYTKSKINAYQKEALANLAAINVDLELKKPLLDLAGELTLRQA